MIKIANQKVLKLLAYKSFQANRSRNLIAIIAIALTTILFTTLFTISIGMVETFQNETMRQSGGKAHATLKYLNQEQFDKIQHHPLIETIGCNVFVAMADNQAFLKRHTEIMYSTDEAARMNFSIPSTGKMPREKNEIVADTGTLDLLGVPHQLGQKVQLAYTLKGEKRSHQFVLAGFYKSDKTYPVGQVIVSRPFIDTELAGVVPNYREDYDAAGTIRADIMFKNSRHIEANIQKVITDSGYSINQKDNNSLAYGVNWAYMSTNFEVDPGSIIGFLLAAILILFTGYLIIYNVFQISVIKDIRFYGLLKTIGTTPRQINGIIARQAFFLSLIGIPIGLFIGYLLGNKLLPVIVSISNFSSAGANASPNPVIFLGAAIFALITVFISCRKPGKTAGRVSPVEAVRYTGITVNHKRKDKKTTDGGKLYKMALSNLGRSKKTTVIVVISMSLSLVLLNSMFTISNGFDMDKYLSKFVKTDFLLGHANYFNVVKLFRSEEDALSEKFIAAVSAQEGFERGGRLYYNLEKCNIKVQGKEDYLQLFGLEDYPLTQLDIVAGQLDWEKFQTGHYILEGMSDDDNGKIYWDRSPYKIGDKVMVTTEKGTYEFEIMAKCRMGYSNHVRYYSNYGFYLPSSTFCSIVNHPTVMSYQLDVDDAHIASMEAFVKGYTQNIEPVMNYESKASYAGEFKKLQNMVLLMGGVLSLIIGLIGILNFINSMLTSILARRQEFAMLQSIGMTDRQLHQLLVYEGLFYALATIVTSFVLGIGFSFGIINGIVSKLWFFSYHFMITPLLISYPILIALSILIPFAAYYGVNRQSIVERLREIE